MFDYHIHTKLCKHAYGELYEYVERAIKIGFSEICFTDHMPMPKDFDQSNRMELEDMVLYLNWIEKAKKHYPEINILTGIEAEYYEGYENYIYNFLSNYSFDLVLMSVHYVKKWKGKNWVFNYNFPEKTFSQIYKEYLDAVNSGIKTGFYDAVAHLDILKQPHKPFIDNVLEEIKQTIELIKKKDMSIEVNTSGLRKKAKEIFPSKRIIELIVNKKVPMIIGSDSHEPAQVGFMYNKVLNELSDINNLKIAKYRKRKIIALIDFKNFKKWKK